MSQSASVTVRQPNPEVVEHCQRLARESGVTASIHPEDFIFWFVHDHLQFKTDPAGAAEHYFEVGKTSARKVEQLARQYGAPPNPSVLEFASGYGCVTRHLKRAFPEAHITSCDIHEQANAFTEKEMGVATLSSSHAPEDFVCRQKFDAIFAISFFSHMPKSTWQKWLQALADQLLPRGLLIFTTHGEASLEIIGKVEIDDEGFWFAPSSEQHDLKSEEYGSTLTTFDYVYKQIKRTRGVHLVSFDEAFWFGHQDAYVLRHV